MQIIRKWEVIKKTKIKSFLIKLHFHCATSAFYEATMEFLQSSEFLNPIIKCTRRVNEVGRKIKTPVYMHAFP